MWQGKVQLESCIFKEVLKLSEKRFDIKAILDKIPRKELKSYEKPKPKWLKKDTNCNGWTKYE